MALQSEALAFATQSVGLVPCGLVNFAALNTVFWISAIVLDVDECATNTDTCTGSQICINVYGGFRCLDDVTYTSGESASLFVITVIATVIIIIIIIIISEVLRTQQYPQLWTSQSLQLAVNER